MNKDIIVGLICILVGCIAIIYRTPYAQKIIDFQNTVWSFNFGERDIKMSKIVIIIVGCASIVFGFLLVFHLIHFKK